MFYIFISGTKKLALGELGGGALGLAFTQANSFQ